MEPDPGEGTDPEITVILPALDEEETIGDCIRKILAAFRTMGVTGEIIVADSSRDQTPEIAAALGARVIVPEKPGYGNAYLAALPYARGKYIVIGDADNTYDFTELPQLIAPLRKGKDFVIGSRFRGTIHPGSMAGLHRYIGNPLLTRMINVLFCTRFSDAHSGMRAITREALMKLPLSTGGMEFASEMLVFASREGLAIEEVPINYYPRKTPSKLHSFADGWRHIRFVLLLKPLPFVAIPGFLFSIVGLLLMAFFYLEGNVENAHLHRFIMGAIFVIGGLQVILTGFLMKTYSVIHGFERKAGIITHVMQYSSLEKLILLGGILIIGGCLFGLNILVKWITVNFGILSEISTAVISLVLVVTGLQIFLFAVFQSMMLLNDPTGSREKT